MPSLSFFDILTRVDKALIDQLTSYAMALVDNRDLVLTIIFFTLGIELILAALMALTDSGQKALSSAINAILFMALIYGITTPTAWKIVIGITKDFPAAVIHTVDPSGDSENIKTNLADKLSQVIQNLLLPGALSTNKALTPEQMDSAATNESRLDAAASGGGI